MKSWLYVRIGLILFSFIGTLLVSDAAPTPDFDWNALAILTAVIPMMLLFVVGGQTLNSRSASTWQRPSWRLNPFNFSEPLQFFDLAAWNVFTQGLAILIRSGLGGLPFNAESFIGVASGISAWFGVRLCMVR